MLALFLKFVPEHQLSEKEASGPEILVLNSHHYCYFLANGYA